MVVSDVSGILKDEINIMKSIRTNAERTARQAVQAILDNLRKTEGSRLRKPMTKSRNIFEEDEANQMEAEKHLDEGVYDKTHASAISATSSTGCSGTVDPAPIFQFGIVPPKGLNDRPSASTGVQYTRDAWKPSGDP